jgi:hypothetical protein
MRVFAVAKLKPHVSIESALAELRVIEARILQAYPDRWFAGIPRMGLWPLQEKLLGNVRRALMILQVAGVFVLLIACANIANLLLARAAARRREIAIRSAIGAGATRVLRQSPRTNTRRSRSHRRDLLTVQPRSPAIHARRNRHRPGIFDRPLSPPPGRIPARSTFSHQRTHRNRPRPVVSRSPLHRRHHPFQPRLQIFQATHHAKLHQRTHRGVLRFSAR